MHDLTVLLTLLAVWWWLGVRAGTSSFAGAAVCCGAGEYAAIGDTTCTACLAGTTVKMRIGCR